MENVVVGIDLGTTYSAVAKVNKITGELNILKNSKGNYTTPSVIAFDGEQFLLVKKLRMNKYLVERLLRFIRGNWLMKLTLRNWVKSLMMHVN